MLNIYLDKNNKRNKNVQYYNDAFFNLYASKIDFNKSIIFIIKQIDGVEYAGNNRVFSKFQSGTQIRVEELSTGCKTAINTYSFPGKIFYAGECGENALQVICNFNKGNILVTALFIPLPFTNNIRVVANNKEAIIKNNNELENILVNYFNA